MGMAEHVYLATFDNIKHWQVIESRSVGVNRQELNLPAVLILWWREGFPLDMRV